MRAFIGLNFNRELKKELYDLQNNIRLSSYKGSWVSQSNFHITLKFLGDINENQVDEINRIIELSVYNVSPISISIDEIGYFNMRKDRYGVIWAGIRGELMKLTSINDIIEEKMQSIGFPMERRKFKPHITLGRRVMLKETFNQMAKRINFRLEIQSILDSVALIKSEEIRGRRIYTPVKECLLR